MSVRIRMKKLGRRHRPFYRICAMDSRVPRDGRVLEELGTYDPMVPDVDARAVLDGERIKHWLEVGAQPSEKVGVLIKKYGPDGTHLEQQKVALDQLAESRRRPEPPQVEAEAEVVEAEAVAVLADRPAVDPQDRRVSRARSGIRRRDHEAMDLRPVGALEADTHGRSQPQTRHQGPGPARQRAEPLPLFERMAITDDHPTRRHAIGQTHVPQCPHRTAKRIANAG